jgi:hypothetical protein
VAIDCVADLDVDVIGVPILSSRLRYVFRIFRFRHESPHGRLTTRNDVDRLDARPKSLQQVVDKVPNDEVRTSFAAIDDTADEDARIRVLLNVSSTPSVREGASRTMGASGLITSPPRTRSNPAPYIALRS